MATAEGTWAYRDRFGDRYGRTYFRRFGPGVVSSVGLGTYLGEPTDAVDDAMREVVCRALDAGCNHVDTASNYRGGRSERAVGAALDATTVARDRVVVASKAGFLPVGTADDPARAVRERFVEPGILDRDDLARGVHAVSPSYLSWALDRSLDRLGVETLDCYYVHNPETQLAARDRAAVYDQLEAAFTTLERRRAAGDVAQYGVATWTALRVPPTHEDHLDLAELCARADAAAEHVGNANHGLATVQLPFNVRMADAFTVGAHGPDDVSALRFAHREGLAVVASAALAQGELARPGAIPDGVDDALAGDTPAQRAINFARSAPAVRSALVGTTDPDHLREDLAAGTFDPMGADRFDRVFE